MLKRLYLTIVSHFALLAAFLNFSAFAAEENDAAALKPGDPAPPFSLRGSDGKTYKLADFKGKKAVVVAWFPKAFTGG